MTDRARASDISAFVERVVAQGSSHHRDFPWRDTSDPYAVLVSEVMLQQTQAPRVVRHFEEWMAAFPTLEALAAAPLEAVLLAWRGLGYNRRALALKRVAETTVATHAASGLPGPAALPRDDAALRALPGIGPATAAGVRAFAFGEHAAYLETNVRSVFLHELFADADGVGDSEVIVLVREAAEVAREAGVPARAWNEALLDYGAHLKRTVPNPSRRSAHHTRQSAFEGSRRQKRSRLLRAVTDAPGQDAPSLAIGLGLDRSLTETLLAELAAEGFLAEEGGRWRVAG